MKDKDFKDLLNRVQEDTTELLKNKGKEYTIGSDDRLANFKTAATFLGIHPIIVWSIYFYKHIASIFAFVKFGKVHSNESIHSRFIDAINYLILGLAIIEEEKMDLEVECKEKTNKSAPNATD